VNSAIEIQKILENENNKLPPKRRMDFRIGINLGNVLHKDDRIYGDGVNVAAWIESLADPGGICISRGGVRLSQKKMQDKFTRKIVAALSVVFCREAQKRGRKINLG
jgi:class 3 adenylate cyclase